MNDTFTIDEIHKNGSAKVTFKFVFGDNDRDDVESYTHVIPNLPVTDVASFTAAIKTFGKQAKKKVLTAKGHTAPPEAFELIGQEQPLA